MNYLEQITPQDEQIKRGLGISLALHAIIFSFFILKTVFFEKESIDFSQAVRVDIVGLPDKVNPTTLPPPAKEAGKPEQALPDKKKEEPLPPAPVPVTKNKVTETKAPAKKEEGVSLEKVKSKQQSALDKLKAMAALDKIKEAVANDKKEKPTGNATGGAQKIKGNILSPGTALSGLAKLQHETYSADLDRHIKQNWSLPEWLAKRDFKAQVRVYIDSRGNIIDRKIVKSSGNPSYDEEVLATIDRSSPFPIPPEKFLAIVSVDGILIGFPE
ncbi:MAG: energy transducer TonB [Bdellovibrio sp.]